MGERRASRAFVLRTVDYGDRDVVATLFDESTGKVSAIAKNARGSKRRFGGGIEPMRLLRVHLVQRRNADLERLDELEVLEDHDGIRESFDKITLGSYATDLLRALVVEGESAPALFSMVEHWFARLAEAAARPDVLDVLLGHFQLEALRHAGLEPALRACSRCGKPAADIDKIYALRSGEGILCPDCVRTGEEAGVLHPGTLDVLDYYRSPDGTVPEAVEHPTCRDQARRLLEAAVEHAVERPLKSRAMLASVLPSHDSPDGT